MAQKVQTTARRVRRDLLAGLLAISAVLVIAIRAAIVGSDLRMLFAISMAAFFVAALVRSRDAGGAAWLRGLIVSLPGLLGTAALIVNDGLARWPIPLMISVLSTGFAIAGVHTSRAWGRNRMRSMTWACGSGAAIPMIALLLVPSLVTFASVRQKTAPTPPFAIRTESGQVVTSEALHGRVVVMASWASWCLPCRWELPEVDRSYAHFRGDGRVAFFAVDRAANETPVRARRFLDHSRLALPLAFEARGVAQVFGSDALPMVVIVDQHGNTRFVHHGYDASEHLDDVVNRTVAALLAEGS